MREKILAFCQEQGLFQGETLLLAVSGGRDSMAMLHFFQGLQGIGQIAVGHFDHQSRQGASTKDAQFVQDYAKKHGLAYYEATAPVESRAKAEKMGFEAMARQLRYEFLAETAEKIQAQWVLTAHQAEDNVETFLHHFCRGTGLAGLAGIAPRREKLLRPLLSVTRGEISRYVAENAVPFVEDSSNTEEKYRRNFVRHQILPKLAEVNPQSVSHATNTMSIIRQENNFLEDYVNDLVYIRQVNGFRVVAKSDFLTIPEALRQRWIGVFAEKNLSFAQRQGLLKEMTGDSYGGYLLYEEKTGQIHRQFPHDKPENLLLEDGFVGIWGLWIVQVVHCRAPDVLPVYDDRVIFLEKTPTLFLRTRQEGDKIPVAGRARYSLKKYLQQEGIPPWERDFLPILTDGEGTILAVGGLAVAEGCQAKPKGDAWKIRWKNKNEV